MPTNPNNGRTGVYYIPAPGARVLIMSAAPTFAVVEEVEKFGDSRNRVVAKCTISGAGVIVQGAVRALDVKYRVVGASEGDWRDAKTITVEWTTAGVPGSFVFRVQDVPYDIDGINLEFQVQYLNADNKPARLGTNQGAIVASTAQALFNGVNDFTEIPQVTGLHSTNTDDWNNTTQTGGLGGSTGSNPANIPADGVIHLVWDKMQEHDCAVDDENDFGTGPNMHPCADGNNHSPAITNDMWRDTKASLVFVWVGPQDSMPDAADQHPKTGIVAGGEWFYVTETNRNEIDVKCPEGKNVLFWVGAKIRNISIYATGIKKLEYSQFAAVE